MAPGERLPAVGARYTRCWKNDPCLFTDRVFTPASQLPEVLLSSLVQQIGRQDERSYEELKQFYDDHHPRNKHEILVEAAELTQFLLNFCKYFLTSQSSLMVSTSAEFAPRK